MKKIIPLGITVLLLSCHSNKGFTSGSPLPSVNMLLCDSTAYQTDQIPKGKYTVIMYFRTDCEHCQRETVDIVKNNKALNNLNIIFLTPKSLEELKRYASFYKLGGYENIKAATDNRLEFMTFYKPANVPYLVVYNRENRLYRIYDGPVPVDSLRVLNNSL